MSDSDEPTTKKVNFKVIIPDDYEIETVKIFRKIKDSQDFEELEAQDSEDYDSDEDDSDYIPESSDDELDAYEYAELSDKDRAKLRKELQQIILDNEWYEFNQS